MVRRRLRIANFNVENLLHPGVFFDGRDRSAPYDEALFDDKAAWIARLIDEAKPHFIGFEEIFSLSALQTVLARSSHFGGMSGAICRVPGCEVDPATGEAANFRRDPAGRPAADGPHCGFATTLPVIEVEAIQDFPAGLQFQMPTGRHKDPGVIVDLPIRQFQRAVIRARVLLPDGRPATMLVAHLKSKAPLEIDHDPQGDRDVPIVAALGRMRALIYRAAEAVALRQIITDLIDSPEDGGKGEALILVGDLNDDLGAVSNDIIAGEKPRFYHPDAVKRRLWDILLYSAHEVTAARSLGGLAYSHIHDGRYSILDHIFFSQEFFSGNPKRRWSFLNSKIHTDHLDDAALSMPEEPEKVEIDGQWRDLPVRRSDHGMVVAEFEMAGPPGET